MDEQEAERLNADLLAALRESAPWAAEQIDESVRQGKPVAKQARRRRGSEETAMIVKSTDDLGRAQFSSTQDLSCAERLRVTLDAVERLLIDPALIADEVRRGLREAGVSKVEFADPGEDVQRELGGHASRISSQHRKQISALLKRLKLESTSVR